MVIFPLQTTKEADLQYLKLAMHCVLRPRRTVWPPFLRLSCLNKPKPSDDQVSLNMRLILQHYAVWFWQIPYVPLNCPKATQWLSTPKLPSNFSNILPRPNKRNKQTSNTTGIPGPQTRVSTLEPRKPPHIWTHGQPQLRGPGQRHGIPAMWEGAHGTFPKLSVMINRQHEYM